MCKLGTLQNIPLNGFGLLGNQRLGSIQRPDYSHPLVNLYGSIHSRFLTLWVLAAKTLWPDTHTEPNCDSDLESHDIGPPELWWKLNATTLFFKSWCPLQAKCGMWIIFMVTRSCQGCPMLSLWGLPKGDWKLTLSPLTIDSLREPIKIFKKENRQRRQTTFNWRQCTVYFYA